MRLLGIAQSRGKKMMDLGTKPNKLAWNTSNSSVLEPSGTQSRQGIGKTAN
jgi:ribosomal protein L24E